MTMLQSRAVLLIVTLCAAVSAGAAATSPSDPAGAWEGAISLPGQRLEVVVRLERSADGGLTGVISIPAQGARDLPLEALAWEPPTVRFTISGVPGEPRFEGALSADGLSIEGTFRQSGLASPFRLDRAGTAAKRATGMLDEFRGRIRGALEAWKVPGAAIAVVRGGEVLLAEGFGTRDRERVLPVTENTLFAIGSATKAFTTFVLASMVDEGALDWDDRVRDLVPGFRLEDPHAAAELTVRDLVTHRSGLPRHDLVWYGNQKITRAELVRRVGHLAPAAGLRERLLYNNLMYAVAGHVIEVVTGRSWEENVRERIFAPLGMRAVLSVDALQADADHAVGWRENDDGALEPMPYRPIEVMGPAGSINASAVGMARWMILHLGGGRFEGRELLPAGLLAELHAPQVVTGARPVRPDISPADYALGWFVETWRGHRRVWHGGHIDGFSAMVSLFPDDRLGIVVLVNVDGSAFPEMASRHAADLLLGLDEVPWLDAGLTERSQVRDMIAEARSRKAERKVPGTRPAHALADYAGTYLHPGYGALEIVQDGERLRARFHGLEAKLEHWHYETFLGEAGGERALENMAFRFETDAAGRVASVHVPLEPAVEPVRFARQPDPALSDPGLLARLVGRYRLGPQIVSVTRAGNHLTLSVPGQPPYRLVPALGGEFRVEQAPGIAVRFDLPERGPAQVLTVFRAGGVFRAERIDETPDGG